MVVAEMEKGMLDPIEAARKAVEVASDKLASDVVLLDLRDLAAFTDFFIVCSADSSRQISAIVRSLDEVMEAAGLHLRHKVGADQSGWVLMDFGEVIVHIFNPEERAYYDLEAVWSQAHQVVRIQ